MTDDDFHARRLTGLGGDDAAAALALNPYRSPYDVWVQKRTPLEDFVPREPTEPMIWGTILQAPVLSEYSRRTGLVVEAEPEMLRHDKYTWMIAHLDGRVVNDRIVEIKTTRSASGWGEPGSDEIPMHYAVQVHHYLIVSGAELCDVAVLIGGSDFRIYTIHADPVIAAELIAREAEFWQRVEQNNPPDPVNLHDATARWGRLLIEGAVEAGRFELDAIDSLRRFRQQKKALEEAEENAKVAIMTALGERGDTLVDANGTRLATWALDKGRKAYTVKAREPQRRFLLKG